MLKCTAFFGPSGLLTSTLHSRVSLRPFVYDGGQQIPLLKTMQCKTNLRSQFDSSKANKTLFVCHSVMTSIYRSQNHTINFFNGNFKNKDIRYETDKWLEHFIVELWPFCRQLYQLYASLSNYGMSYYNCAPERISGTVAGALLFLI